MIDSKAVASELKHARTARLRAEAAWCEVEELLWEVQHSPRYWQRLALVDVEHDEDASPPLAA
jgi:hypothetical protein